MTMILPPDDQIHFVERLVSHLRRGGEWSYGGENGPGERALSTYTRFRLAPCPIDGDIRLEIRVDTTTRRGGTYGTWDFCDWTLGDLASIANDLTDPTCIADPLHEANRSDVIVQSLVALRRTGRCQIGSTAHALTDDLIGVGSSGTVEPENKIYHQVDDWIARNLEPACLVEIQAKPNRIAAARQESALRKEATASSAP